MKTSDAFARELLEEVQAGIASERPLLDRRQCRDDFEHGYHSGAFSMLVGLRRSLKERIAAETPDLFAPTK